MSSLVPPLRACHSFASGVQHTRFCTSSFSSARTSAASRSAGGGRNCGSRTECAGSRPWTEQGGCDGGVQEGVAPERCRRRNMWKGEDGDAPTPPSSASQAYHSTQGRRRRHLLSGAAGRSACNSSKQKRRERGEEVRRAHGWQKGTSLDHERVQHSAHIGNPVCRAECVYRVFLCLLVAVRACVSTHGASGRANHNSSYVQLAREFVSGELRPPLSGTRGEAGESVAPAQVRRCAECMRGVRDEEWLKRRAGRAMRR